MTMPGPTQLVLAGVYLLAWWAAIRASDWWAERRDWTIPVRRLAFTDQLEQEELAADEELRWWEDDEDFIIWTKELLDF